MAQATIPNRSVRLDLPPITDGSEITVTVGGETFSGSVTRIDTYGESTESERVIQFNMNHKHRIDGPDWTPWKAYLVEEPAGVYRVNLMLSNGSGSRSRNLEAPDMIVVE